MITKLNDMKNRLKDFRKEDELVSVEDVTMNKNGKMIIRGKEYRIDDIALDQSARKIGSAAGIGQNKLKGSFLSVCPPELRAENFNTFRNMVIKKNNEQGIESPEWLVRRRGDNIRAILSKGYSVLDNDELIDILGDYAGGENLEFKYSWTDGNNMMVRAINDNIRIGEGKDSLYAGWNLSNSEVGLGSIKVDFVIYQLICTNGLVGMKEYGRIFSQRHDAIDRYEMKEKFINSLNNINEDKAYDALEKYYRTKEKPLEYDVEVIFRAINKNHPEVTKKVIEGANKRITKYFDRNHGLSQFTIISALTETAKDYYEGEKRLRLERICGRLLDKNSILNRNLDNYIEETDEETERILNNKKLSAGEQLKLLFEKED